MSIEFAQEDKSKHIPVAKIYVVGIGGAGGNTINCMKESDYQGVSFIAVNTDAQALACSKADSVIQIGQKSTKGLGAGANPEIGRRAAEEDIDKVLESVQGADIVFLTAGMGGGTGSGALPVVVKALKERGILTIVVITKPFTFEGKRRARIAEEAIKAVREHADTILIVPNQKLLNVVDAAVSMIDGFAMINEILNQSVKSISDIITRAGHINVDFADVREIMRAQGLAIMGTGRAKGLDRARTAALEAISSPLLENMDISGARGVLINITGSVSLGLHEISEAALVVYEKADEDANIILGSVIDESMGDVLSVTIIATGFKEQDQHEFPLKPLVQHHVEHTSVLGYTQPKVIASVVSLSPVAPFKEIITSASQEPFIENNSIVELTKVIQENVSLNEALTTACVVPLSTSDSTQAFIASTSQLHEDLSQAKEQFEQKSYEGDKCELKSFASSLAEEELQEQLLNEQLPVEKINLGVVDNDSIQQQEQYSTIQNLPQNEQQYNLSANSTASIDLKNFDIPAFMRQKKDRINRHQRRENRNNNGHKGQW